MACCYCAGGWMCSSSMGSHALVSFALRAHCSLPRVLLRTLCPCWSSNTLPPCPCGHCQPFPTSQSEPFYKIMNQIMWLACLVLPVADTILRKTKANKQTKNQKTMVSTLTSVADAIACLVSVPWSPMFSVCFLLFWFFMH